MKKIISLFLAVLMAQSIVYTQAPFEIVSWVRMMLADNPDATYYDIDFSETPFEKKIIEPYRLPDTENIDINQLTLDQLKSLWNSVSEENFVSNIVVTPDIDPYDLDANGNGTYGASFKVIFNSEDLYVLFKFIDKNKIADEWSKEYEIMIQTKDYDRYEDGFAAATGKFGVTGTNAQYGRFVELGGMNVVLNANGVLRSDCSIGQEGRWGPSLLSENTPPYKWYTDTDDTEWTIIGLNYNDFLVYMDDEWGAYDYANYVPFNPDEINAVSFDVRSTIIKNEERLSHCWNSKQNDVYAFNYYAGYLVFNPGGFLPRPLAVTPVHYCTGEPAAPLEAYGENLLWYTESSGGTGSVEPPIPSTSTPGVYNYWVSQAADGNESPRTNIKVFVDDFTSGITGDPSLTCNSEGIFEAFTNYKGESPLSYSWIFGDNEMTGQQISIGPLKENGELVLTARTESGCHDEISKPISLGISENPLVITHVGYDNESGKNKITWTTNQNPDSLFIYRGTFTRLPTLYKAVALEPSVYSYIDSASSPEDTNYTYQLAVKDGCGNFTVRSTTWNSILLDGIQYKDLTFDLLWNQYYGVYVKNYSIYVGHSPSSLYKAGEVGSNILKWHYPQSVDTLYYQLVAELTNYTDDPDAQRAYSNIYRMDPLDQSFHDTVWIETCTGLNDTLKIDAGLNIGLDPNLSFIKVYPNPTDKKIVVDMNDFTLYSSYSLRIVSTEGKVIFNDNCRQPVFEINLSDFGKNGMYYLQFINPDGAVIDSRVIVLQ